MASVRCIARQEILQEEVDVIIGIENQIRTLQRVYNERTASILSRLLAGCAVERGSNQIETEEVGEGPQQLTRLVINGRPA